MKNIGNFEVTEKIGEGGMATVYKGVQASLNRPVAVKLLSQKVAGHQEIVERFNRESLIIARLTHPNIIHVIDRGITDEGRPFFIMDFVEGTTLSKVIKKDQISFAKKLDLIIQICKGLSYAHKNGVIHRDIKPANILIDEEENAILTDFGIAQLFSHDGGADELNKDGLVLGTLSYMSPEQKRGLEEVSAASDLYSLGVMMYEMFTRKKPAAPIKRPSDLVPNFPEYLEVVILKCLANNPKDRFQSADEVRDELLQSLHGEHLEAGKREKALKGISNLKNRFALLDVISENRFGAVNLLQDKTDNQLMVAKKCRNFREAAFDKRRLTSLRHKNIVKIFGLTEDRNHSNIIMEYVSGGSLSDRMLTEHPWREVLLTAKAVCEGLSFAHKQGLVHGNIRPSNILIDEWGDAKISDFGLEEHYPAKTGKYDWYRPAGEGVTTQSDLYAVGVIMYEMLTRTRPLWRQGKIVPNKIFQTLPEAVQALLMKMIAQNKAERYQDVAQVFRAINGLLEEKKPAMPLKAKKEIQPKKKQTGLWIFLFFAFLVLLGVLARLKFPHEIKAFLERIFS